MTRNAYVDESQRPGLYVVASVAVEHHAVASVRRELGRLAPRGVGRRHFVKEMDTTRRTMLNVFAQLEGIEVLAAMTGRPDVVIEQRSRCVEALAVELRSGGIDRVILDHVDDAQRRRDRRTLARVLHGTRVTYAHEPDHSSEALLWVPDAVAWCVGRRDWRPALRGWVRIIET